MTGSWSSSATEAIARLVSTRTGFTYALQHAGKTEDGIRRAMSLRAENSPHAYLALLGREPSALDDLMDELTIRETYFFREPRHFEFIRNRILPGVRSVHGGGRSVRAWSAGCASGEEPYSLAILLSQMGLVDEASVLGTDISQAALATARGGRYRDWSLRGASPDFMARYFRSAGPSWSLVDPVKRCVRFAFLNLALDAYPSHVSGTHAMDLILCRNVLIYFDAWTVGQVARRLRDSLAPGGWLVTASSDPTLGRDAGLEPHVTEYGVFYQRPVEAARAPAPSEPSYEAPALPEVPVARAPARPAARRVADPVPVDPLEQAHEALRRGEYELVLRMVPDLAGGAEACRLRVDALANRDGPEAAVEAAGEALRRHPVCPTLNFRHAVLLSSLGRLERSEEALRRVLYLDRRLAVAHFAMGALHWRCRRLEAARRCYRSVVRICEAHDAAQPLPLGEGQSAAALAAAAARHLAALGEGEAIPA